VALVWQAIQRRLESGTLLTLLDRGLLPAQVLSFEFSGRRVGTD
jgi:hypothetical protein